MNYESTLVKKTEKEIKIRKKYVCVSVLYALLNFSLRLLKHTCNKFKKWIQYVLVLFDLIWFGTVYAL